MYYRIPEEFFVEVISVEDLDIVEKEFRSSLESDNLDGESETYLEVDNIEASALEESDEEYVNSEVSSDSKLV